MGQAVKYAILAAALAVFLAMAAAYVGELPVSDSVASLMSGVTNVVYVCGQFFKSARGLLNALTGVPELINALISIALVLPFAKFVMKIVISVYRWMNQ